MSFMHESFLPQILAVDVPASITATVQSTPFQISDLYVPLASALVTAIVVIGGNWLTYNIVKSSNKRVLKEQRLYLSNQIKKDLLKDLCDSFGQFYGVGVQLVTASSLKRTDFDSEKLGEMLERSAAAHSRIIGMLYSLGGCSDLENRLDLALSFMKNNVAARAYNTSCEKSGELKELRKEFEAYVGRKYSEMM